MTGHHSQPNEIPEFRDRIHELKLHNPQLAELHRQRQDVGKETYCIEERIKTPCDCYPEDLKNKRVLLKDQLYAMLRNA
jgi:uncharacterized protein YdcH (DUF465 family)